MSQSQAITLNLTFDAGPLERQLWNIQRGFRAVARERRRKWAEAIRVGNGLPPRPSWLDADPATFSFPGWEPRSRPFDFAVDEADVPVPDPLPAWAQSERRQIDLYLRAPARVVQR